MWDGNARQMAAEFQQHLGRRQLVAVAMLPCQGGAELRNLNSPGH